MLKRILVPLDGSECSEKAVPYAQSLASSSAAELVFLQAVSSVHDYQAAEASLALFVDQARACGLRARAVVRVEAASASIVQTATSYEADIVVMSTHGRSGLTRVVWGSVTDLVLRHALVPVLVVPRDVDGQWSSRGPMRVIVPLDGSDLAEQAIAPAQSVAQAASAPLVLLREVEPTAWDAPWPVSDPAEADTLEPEAKRAGCYLGDVARKLDGSKTEICVDVYRGGAAAAIRRAARERPGSLIVMASHGRGGVSRAIFGSIADAVLHTARTPVLVVRPAAVRVAQMREAVEPDLATGLAGRFTTVA